VRALRGVDLELGSGEVLALVGENGAGKSTLIKILGGAVLPDKGSDRDAGPSRPRPRTAGGSASGHQHYLPGVQPRAGLTARETIFLGQERRREKRCQEPFCRERPFRCFAQMVPDTFFSAVAGWLPIAREHRRSRERSSGSGSHRSGNALPAT